MAASLILLLQLAASLLASAQNNPAVTQEERVLLVSTAGQAVQLAAQAIGSPEIYAQGGAGESIWPNYSQLLRARYISLSGVRVPLGGEVRLDGETISFGDIDGDGKDDAIVVVMRSIPSSADWRPAFAIMLNQGGGNLFNIGDLPLPKGYALFDHRIENRQFKADMAFPGETRRVRRYKLVGTELLEIAP